MSEVPPPHEGRMHGKSKQDEIAADFQDRLNATPSKAPEADRFRLADDRFKALSRAAFDAVASVKDATDLPPDIVTTLECWCILHEAETRSVAKCAELAADPEEFRLVGSSTLEYLAEEDREVLQKLVDGLSSEEVAKRPHLLAEVASAMLEWMQAALAVWRWAVEERKKPQD
eukprot:gnl/TRDRNA2_/TRDRNA2_179689_c0_seq1.p2 gnl/TRDRNA2_/TRDRNA2_179689_c0~~gnl/TRDRNA2_/TRDRNA2_179689_c0_seq1.p2  ORF type:complete len:173 (-),score=44.34 gnl/TRDRNA2_/TRDRNA2_179689_c0_seq1:208-726(-)